MHPSLRKGRTKLSIGIRTPRIHRVLDGVTVFEDRDWTAFLTSGVGIIVNLALWSIGIKSRVRDLFVRLGP
jgi:hypothetical protein